MFPSSYLDEVKKVILEIEERTNALQDMLYSPIMHAIWRPVEDKTIESFSTDNKHAYKCTFSSYSQLYS